MPYYLIYGGPSPIQVYASDPQAAVFYARQALSGQIGRTDLAALYAGAPMPSPQEGVPEIAGSAKSAGESGADQPQRPGSVTTQVAAQPVTSQTTLQPGGGRPGPGAGPQGTFANAIGPSFANLGSRLAETEIDPDTGLPRFVPYGLLTSFRQALANRGINENSAFGDYARGQFGPLSDIYQVRSGLNLQPAAGELSFQNFAQGNPDIMGLAGPTFSELLRQGQDPQNVFAHDYTTGEPGTATSRALSLAFQALGGQGRILPEFISNSIRPRVVEEFQTRSPSENFLSYLRRTLGLA